MIGIVVTGHGLFAEGMHSSAVMIAGENEALLVKLQKAFKYQLNGKMLVAEFAPDKALTCELIAVMAKKGTDLLMNAADPKNLFRMPSSSKQ